VPSVGRHWRRDPRRPDLAAAAHPLSLLLCSPSSHTRDLSHSASSSPPFISSSASSPPQSTSPPQAASAIRQRGRDLLNFKLRFLAVLLCDYLDFSCDCWRRLDK
jgi:hypothetical protein